MFYGDNVKDTRQMFYSSWHKYRHAQPLLPVEQQIVNVIADHPEYQTMLENSTPENEQAYFPELGQTNPFLHMGLHLAVRDQLATNRPAGIVAVYQQLLTKYQDRLAVEHLLLEKLAECLWQAQRTASYPDENQYLLAVKLLL
ncbi:DUF1841 domain-containing protein [Legionella taurinensis]|uniref:DUF1841 domain-containing protein n=1 Tax=Legionella taurinensis TaxID=70611 RepID=A0A3A5LDZ1_9GAMM|nr:DUF1841 family protein [Legionella taurinensis]MDX1836137.1 DUF1841 family protein [Legionella taurinensis]PUT42091.1 DUF1841 domain-containing protein [Legionella taurinensis]PUT44878.1 DUF1841 domain-containing protein [Legionella taurinensis]PUT48199.1 DUF1841 domain-containing protein [Legionella taurinensis]PUT49013.1 DUF1841 domain-containing protein [Legionella taurinensis]